MLILKHASAAIDVVTSSGADIDVHVSWVDLADASSTSDPDDDNVAITTATTTTVVAGVSTTTARAIKHLSFYNKDASTSNDLTVQLNDGTTTAILRKVTLAPTQTLFYEDKLGWVGPTSSSATNLVTVKHLGTQHDNSTTTPTEVADLTCALTAGTYEFRYSLIYQSGATTTGIRLSANFDGSTTKFVQNMRWVDNSATASTAAADQDAVGAAGQVMGAMAGRAGSTAGLGTTISVDTANADMFAILEGQMVVSTSGNLELWHGSDVAAISSLMVGCGLVVTKIN